jgi:hypothetical protein
LPPPVKSAPFVQTEGKVSAHWHTLKGEIASVLPAQQKTYFDSPASGDTFSTQLGGDLERRFERRSNVAKGVPFLMGPEMSPRYWVSYFERWNRIDARKSIEFHTSSLTFYLTEGERAALQIFRAEWPGFRDWSTGNAGWQAPGAGHPHWQFDAVSHFIEAEEAEAARLTALQRLTEQPAIDFSVALAIQAKKPIPSMDASWSSAHFAMQTKWSVLGWDGSTADCQSHASSPTELHEIRRWVLATTRYCRHELLRADRYAVGS